MNETIDPNLLPTGQRVVLPWVEDDALLDAYLVRAERQLAASARTPPTWNGTPASISAPIDTPNDIPVNRSLDRSTTPGSANPGSGLPTRSPFVTPVSSAPVGRTAAPGPSATGTKYLVQPGESLWGIAARRVGTGRAESYVQSILAANPSIRDASKIPHGVEIRLPPND